MEKEKWIMDDDKGPVFAGLDTLDYPYEITDADEWYKPPEDIITAYQKGGIELAFAEACRIIYQLCYTVKELQTELDGLERRYERHTHREEFVVKD